MVLIGKLDALNYILYRQFDSIVPQNFFFFGAFALVLPARELLKVKPPFFCPIHP